MMTTQHGLRISKPPNVLFFIYTVGASHYATPRPMNRELEAMSKETSAV